MKYRLIHLAILISLLAAPLLPVAGSPARASAAPAAPAAPAQASSEGEVRLWRDEAGDLWVETPLYRWNITAGNQITSVHGDTPWLSVEPARGRRLLDAFFLSSSNASQLTAEIVFSLPDSAMVYLEKSGERGVEGLSLTFRTLDGLISLSHDWHGDDAPPLAMPVGLALPAPDRSRLNRSGNLPARPSALSPEALEYRLQYDQGSRLGFALLKPTQIPEPSPICDSPAASGDSAHASPCSQPGRLALGRQYLLLVSAPAAQVQPALDFLSAELQLAGPDLNAASISRYPSYPYDVPHNNPLPGEAVQFTARVANRGGASTGAFDYIWTLDGLPVLSGRAASLDPGQAVSLSLPWTWQDGPHTVAIHLDPANQLPEISELNNRVEDRTDGLALGFWVERSVYDWFNLNQVKLGLGSVSWEDWAQRQVRAWNQMFALSVSPLTPLGVLDRVRLEKVVVVPDGSLPNPYPTNFPSSDKTVDLMWGFPSELVGVPSTHPAFGPLYLVSPEALNIEYSLLHELSHARYLDDLYGINVVADPLQLAQPAAAGDTVLVMTAEVENISHFITPAYLAVEGELVICQGRDGYSFTGCQRGAEGTHPRSHPAGARLNRATVRLQDGLGSLVMGSPAMPLLGWDDHLYFNRYPFDVMSGGRVYEMHSAYALNRIARQRPVCGNYNPPCNLGEYQNDVPAQNILLLLRNGLPAEGAQVEVYRARPFPQVWYGKLFSGPPDAVYTAGVDGRVDLGPFPFSADGRANAYNRVLLLKITSQGGSTYHWFDITQANEAYWTGQTARAEYPLDLPTTPAVDAWVAATPRLYGAPGQSVQVKVRYGNAGLTPARSVTLIAAYGAALTPTSYSHTPDADSGERLTWSLPDLPAMDTGELSVTFTLPDAPYGTRYTLQWEIASGVTDAALPNNLAATQIEISHTLALPFIRR